MQLTTTLTLLTAALASTAAAGNAVVWNRCTDTIYLTITRANQQSTTRPIASGQRYTETIANQGNSFGVTRNPDYFSPNTPKLIWGFSNAPPTLYYSVSQVNGDPFAGAKFRLKSSDGNCQAITGYDGRTRTCGSNNDYTLVACAQ
ncbi:hypothetical protein BDZ85DRAFT_23949 [Elsinoe ampelina]|uniref:Uncharacterized protein n=1 Tax=Elsinoe ampelina TaxID=302913 RepID=A0A6A6G6C1_9PEZI|nr:hypothetical protein BDZ85DRAFT_23949 [Elsinoe ampelina]